MFGRFRDSVRRLTDVARGVPTIGQLVTQEIEIHLPREVAVEQTAASTLALYRRASVHLIERWGTLRPSDLTLDALRTAMLTAKPRSQWNIWMALLGRVLTRAKDDGVVNATTRLPRFPTKNREARVLPDEYPKVVTILHTMTTERGRGAHDPSSCRALLLCVYSGCRLSESRFLEWDRVYLDLRLIRCGRVKGQEARYGLCDAALELFDTTPRVSRWCFPSRRHLDKPISRMHHAWAEARRRAGLQQHVTIHGLRHSWVTRAASFGSLEQIRRCTNHSAVTMTARYSHLAIADVLPLIVRVGAVIGGEDA